MQVRRLGLTTVAILVAGVGVLLATLPPGARDLAIGAQDPDIERRTLAGAYHVHTSRSDGAGDRLAVAAAAARAGLQFVILTDHGDGTRRPFPPEYVEGVLLIDAVEISTNGGHYVALGLDATPYPLGGEPSAVVEDVARLGGFGIAAHPGHPRAQLAWRDWDLPIDGLEWINADVEWRDDSPLRVARVLFDYLLRPPEALASLFDRPSAVLSRWDALSRARPVIALAAVDAHGGRSRDPDAGERAPFAGPSYEASFRSLANLVLLDRPPTGTAGTDAGLLLQAIRDGRVYSVVTGLGTGVRLRWQEPNGFGVPDARPGEAEVQVFSSGERRRLEIHVPHAPGDPPIPWVLTNWGGRPSGETSATPALEGGDQPLVLASEWRVEKDPRSSGAVTVADGDMSLTFRLAEGERANQFVAAVADIDRHGPFDVLSFQARAERPMRVSVQLRFAPDDRRWVRSVYLDADPRDVILDLASFRPADGGADPVPDLATARSILLVADLVNARPGDAGGFTINDLNVRR